LTVTESRMNADRKTKNRRNAEKLQRAERVTGFVKRLAQKPNARIRYFETNHGRVRTYWYGTDRPDSPVYFDLHGGGFVLGHPVMDEAMNRRIGEEAGCTVVSIEYAKAPRYPYPCALDQIHETIKTILADGAAYGIDASKAAVGGHSAGGNLATALCLKAKGTEPKFVCQILDYPVLDLFTSPYDKPQPKGCIPPGVAVMFNDCYIQDDRAKEIFASPVFASKSDLEGSPPALFVLAGQDSLYDEAKTYARMLTEAGVLTEVHEYPNALHGFTLSDSEDAKDAVDRMIAFLKKHLGAA
jgi:acetyl esterase